MAHAWGLVAIVTVAGATGCRVDLDDWELVRLSDHMAIAEGETLQLVVGQPTSIGLMLQSHESHYYYAPDNVRFTIDHATTLEITVVGEIEIDAGSSTRGATQVDLTASQVGPNRVRFISDSTDEPYSLAITGVAP